MTEVHPWIKKIWHRLGSILGVLAVAFVVVRLHDHAERLATSDFSTGSWAAMAILSIGYGAANSVLALAWYWILRFSGVEVRCRWAFEAYGMTQLAKYVPGNVFQFVGRQAMGMAAGIPGAALARSVVWELGAIGIVGSLFVILALPILIVVEPNTSSGTFAFTLIAALLVIAGTLGREMALVAVLYAIFLFLLGLVFLSTLAIVLGFEAIEAGPALTIVGAYVVGWLVGLVTPGAPAGLGVREFVVLVLLEGQVAEAELLVSLVAARGITAAGDLLFFGYAWLSQRLTGIGEGGKNDCGI